MRGRLRSSRIRSGRGRVAELALVAQERHGVDAITDDMQPILDLVSVKASRVISTSPGSSSTSSTSMTSRLMRSLWGLTSRSLAMRFALGKRLIETSRHLPDSGIKPDLPAVVLDNPFAQREADPGPGRTRPCCAAVGRSRRSDLRTEARSRSRCRHTETPSVAAVLRPDVDVAAARSTELDRVADQVLHELR